MCLKKIISSVCAAPLIMAGPVLYTDAEQSNMLPKGCIAWHSYSDYFALDSSLRVKTPSGTVKEIKGDFVNQMNADFGNAPYDIVFMAIDKKEDEWDLYRYNLITGKYCNLTEKSGFRNEDPKFSNDYKKIVFKRGHRDPITDEFIYDLYETDLLSGEASRLTDTPVEEAMPFYSTDDSMVYYAAVSDGMSNICCFNKKSGKATDIFREENVFSYYPIVHNDILYFTKWFSPQNKNDCIVKLINGKAELIPHQNPTYNYSDVCPLSDNKMIISSTENGSYDLFYFDETTKYSLSDLNTEKNELGAAYYSESDYKDFLNKMEKCFFGYSEKEKYYDINEDGKINILDYCFIKAF